MTASDGSRCCGIATSRRCRRPSGTRSVGRWHRGHRPGRRDPAVAAGTALARGRSTSAGRCARCCAAAASRCAWSTGPAAPAAAAAGPAGRRQRVDGSRTPTRSCASPTPRAGDAGDRGLHHRHPADPGHPRDCAAATPSAALIAAGAAVPDWSGGTRLGEQLKAFLDRWGQRGLARGAVVLVASDGWERGDVGAARPSRCAAAAARPPGRLGNPHRGQDGFAPMTAGMRAALPHGGRLRGRALAGRAAASCRGALPADGRWPHA